MSARGSSRRRSAAAGRGAGRERKGTAGRPRPGLAGPNERDHGRRAARRPKEGLAAAEHVIPRGAGAPPASAGR